MKHNFYAGPAILPQEVLQQAANAVNSFGPHNLSILEISHREKDFVQVVDEACDLVKQLFNLKDSQKVLFLTGGASTQFFVSAMNLLPQNGTAAYIDTGAWSHKAIKEAKLYGNVDIVASSEADGFNHIPKEYDIKPGTSYLHYTSNNTIYGTQFHHKPADGIPLICDMSSDIFSRPMDVSDYQLIYAGAQKNMGPAGVTLVVVDEDALGKTDRVLPTMLDYRTHIKKGSMFNTPPVFPIYVSMLTLRWILKNGGLEAMETRNQKKAALLYDEIDRNSLFNGTVAKEDRSLMNVNFAITKEDLTSTFLAHAEARDCVGLKGHRSVGGFRASIYNAMEYTGVQALVAAMKEFEEKYG